MGDGRLLAICLDKTIIDGRKINVNLPRFMRAPSRTGGRRDGADKGAQGMVTRLDEEKIKVSFRVESNRNFSKSYVEVVVNDPLGQIVKEAENILLNYESNVVHRSKMEKAYVGKVCISGSTYNIQTHLKMEGMFAIRVTPLGDNYSLLEELEEGFIDDLISEGGLWWKSWFTEVKKWEEGMIHDDRDVWFRIYGIPTHVWNSYFLHFVG